jgi:uncharacterized surface protein with fasciclin (FAS1) repeats
MIMASILETLLATTELETLATAIQITDLDRVLNDGGDFTIFAPNNRAFTSLSASALQKLSQEPLLLTTILSMHIIDGKLLHQDLLRMYDLGQTKVLVTSIDGTQLHIDLSNGIQIGSSNVISIDTSAANGIIYPIDRVMLPHSFDRSSHHASTRRSNCLGII